jgi:hypothetical protein
MTKKASWSCNSGDRSFPIVATLTGVASCFAEAILQKHVGFSSGFEIALGLTQAVPLVIVLRYVGTRLGRAARITSAQEVR